MGLPASSAAAICWGSPGAPLVTDTLAQLQSALRDRYQIDRPVGAGGMATVFLATDLRHHRRVAIKVLRPELAALLGPERFLREITTTAQLQHPHILPLFDSGSEGGFLYYVMPFLDGESLRGKLDRETQLSVEESVRIATEVADALDYAHRHGIVHRDIKPENILLHDGRATVADFGIALAVSAAGGGRMTETGVAVGTPHYMSPEQAAADRESPPRAGASRGATTTGSTSSMTAGRFNASPRRVARSARWPSPRVTPATCGSTPSREGGTCWPRSAGSVFPKRARSRWCRPTAGASRGSSGGRWRGTRLRDTWCTRRRTAR